MEAKELLEYMGIEAENMDDFKKKFPEKYVSDENTAAHKFLSPVIGKKFGKVKQSMLNRAREQGLEFTQSEFDDKELEDVAEILSEKKATKYKTELEELKKKTTGTSDEAIKELEEKYNKAAQRAADEEKLRKDLASEFDNFKGQAATEVKGVKLSYMKSDLMSKLKFKPGISDLEREGFNAHVEKNYKFDFDDQGKPFVTDVSGNRIRSAKKADEFKAPDEVLTEVASQFKILSENPKAGTPVNGSFVQAGSTPPAAPPVGTVTQQPAKRRVNPLMDKYL